MVHMSPAHLRVVSHQQGSGISTSGGYVLPRAERASAVRFSESVRTVVALSRRGGLVPPVFRSPPGHPGADRTIRRRGDKPPVVAIARSDRPLAAVQSDVIEAVVVANELDGRRADRFRRAAWSELERACLTPGSAGERVAIPADSEGQRPTYGIPGGEGAPGPRDQPVPVANVRGADNTAKVAS